MSKIVCAQYIEHVRMTNFADKLLAGRRVGARPTLDVRIIDACASEDRYGEQFLVFDIQVACRPGRIAVTSENDVTDAESQLVPEWCGL